MCTGNAGLNGSEMLLRARSGRVNPCLLGNKMAYCVFHSWLGHVQLDKLPDMRG